MPSGQHNAQKTHCRHGHPYDAQNTGIVLTGGRYCLACHKASNARQSPEYKREKSRRWLANNPEKKRLIQRKSNLKNFGLTIPQYDEMLLRQGGGCAICTEKCSTGWRLAVDHDHKTGVVRGLLCARCNNGLGRFKDSPEKLLLAATYLIKSKEDL